jgi:hypothetical protein
MNRQVVPAAAVFDKAGCLDPDASHADPQRDVKLQPDFFGSLQ